MTRFALPIVLAMLAAGCGSVDYRDINLAVDGNPLCASCPDQPN